MPREATQEVKAEGKQRGSTWGACLYQGLSVECFGVPALKLDGPVQTTDLIWGAWRGECARGAGGGGWKTAGVQAAGETLSGAGVSCDRLLPWAPVVGRGWGL